MKIFIRKIVFVLLVSGSTFLAVMPAFAEKNAEKTIKNPKQAMLKGEKSQLININTASAKELTKGLKGIGMKKAQAVVSYRKKNGEFKSVEDLLKVKGVGKNILENNIGRISI